MHWAFQRLPVGASWHTFSAWLILNSDTHQAVPDWEELRLLDVRGIKACYYKLNAQEWEEYFKCFYFLKPVSTFLRDVCSFIVKNNQACSIICWLFLKRPLRDLAYSRPEWGIRCLSSIYSCFLCFVCKIPTCELKFLILHRPFFTFLSRSELEGFTP